MIAHLGFDEAALRQDISDFERGVREPSLAILLAYGRAAGVWVDVLIDDELDLPNKLPSYPKHEGVRRGPKLRAKRKTSK
jgi:hypothetical protein